MKAEKCNKKPFWKGHQKTKNKRSLRLAGQLEYGVLPHFEEGVEPLTRGALFVSNESPAEKNQNNKWPEIISFNTKDDASITVRGFKKNCHQH